MMKRIILIMAVAFACTSFLMVVSCAQKTTTVEPEKPAVTEKKVEKKTEEAKPSPEREEGKVEVSREEKPTEKELPKKVVVKGEEIDIQDAIRAFEADNIYFDFDKSELKPEALAVLREKGEWLRNNPAFSIRIEGHCDERGTNEYNLALGERRANSAWKFLNALGISGSRLTTISYGEERPAEPGHNEDAWSKNRRDEFKIIQ